MQSSESVKLFIVTMQVIMSAPSSSPSSPTISPLPRPVEQSLHVPLFTFQAHVPAHVCTDNLRPIEINDACASCRIKDDMPGCEIVMNDVSGVDGGVSGSDVDPVKQKRSQQDNK